MGEVAERVDGESMRGMPSRAFSRSHGLALAALLASVALLAGFTGSAHALIHRGHTFASAIETSGANKLSSPTAVAVNERTAGGGAGDVYVLDKANNRVVRLGPKHEFLEAWGVGVKGGAEYEQCKVEAECKPGIPGLGGPTKVKFDEPVAIAVDSAAGSPSAGDVYVAANRTWKRAIVYKFDFEGHLVGTLVRHGEEKAELWPIMGIAVDRTGKVWIDREDEEEDFVIERFDNAVANQLIGEPEEIELPQVVAGRRPARPGFAIDSSGRAYITYEPGGHDIEEEEERIEARAEERKEKKEPKVEEAIATPCQQHACLVARYLPGEPAHEEVRETVLDEEVEVSTFDPETNTTGLAVDTSTGRQSSGDVYLDHGSYVSAFTAEGVPIQKFGQEQLGAGGGTGLGVDATSNEVFAADEPHARVDVFGPQPPGLPAIEDGSLSVAGVTAESAKLKAAIEAAGADTHYYFRYGTEPCSSGPSACAATAPSPPGADIGAGFGNDAVVTEVTGLAASTKYYFVAVATNSFGQVESHEEASFTTLPASTLEAVLPDGRAWELVSPANKRGVAVEPLSHEGGLIEAAANGHALTYIAAAPIGEEEPQGNRAPEPAQLIGSREGGGRWGMRNLTTPNLAAEGIQANTRREYQAFNSDLSIGAVFPFEPLSSAEANPFPSGLPVYLRETSCGPPTKCFQPLTPSSTAAKGSSPLDGATPDLKHIALNLSTTKTGGLWEWSAAGGLASEGSMTQVNFLPGGQEATGHMGFGAPEQVLFEGARQVLSQDGSRVSWAVRNANVTHLYQTQLNAGPPETIQVDEANKEAGLEPSKINPAPVYMTSSSSGDRVFFTDDQRLTANASLGTNPLTEVLEEPEDVGDLYVFERSKPVGHRLTDLTPALKLGESSAVQGGVIGASEDGSYVYFVANGVLAEGASPGRCNIEGLRSSKCNLYEVHNNGAEWEPPRFIARLSNEDGPDWGPVGKRTEYKVVEMTSHVSPDGRYLAFMSDQRLTGYNNNDANTGQPDEEVFLFDAETGHVVCASCNPSGAQPVGVHDVQESGEGRNLLIDRLGIWSTETEDVFSHWLAASVPGWTNLDDRESLYQSRYLSNSGRLFFNAADSLVKGDVNNGKADVYQYEPTGVGGCASPNTTDGCVALISSGKSEHETAFLDASESGNDVFFLTASSLIPSLDTDNAFDVYDARVCSGAEAEEACPPTALPSPPPCNGEECRAAPASQPSFGTPGSANASGSGNIAAQVLGTKAASKPKPLTRAQKLAAALKTCKKRYKSSKKKRAACEKQARSRYGAKKPSKSKKAAKKSSRRGR